MAESRKIKGGFVKKDRISELPRNLQEIILCFLPIRDAVRTSILSTKWRHSWTMIPHLSFDDKMFDYKIPNREWKCHGPEMNALKFVSAINKVLIRHNGPILKFSLNIPSECDDQIIHDYIDQWIPLFTRKGIKQLVLCDDYELLENFSSIGLENLTEFSFKLTCEPATQTETSNVVKFLSNLPKIEKFSAGFGFIKYLAAGGSPNRLPKLLSYLKTLSICNMDFTDSYKISCLLCLIRSAPNLCKLHILADCYSDGKEDLKNCWIEDSEKSSIDNLEIVTFSDFQGRIAELELVKFLLAHSPSLKTMSIHRSEGMKKDVALAMTDDILEFPRSSSRAQIRRLIRPVSITDFDDELWAHFDL
ncbi:hypothetical protein ACET3Z_014020 [Daucus carota]